MLAAFVTLSLGVVLGPEAPLIAIGSGLGVLAIHLLKRDAQPMAVVVVGVAGSFAAISTLLGSPIVGAFLLMEVAGLGGPLLGVVLVPGLIAAGVGSLIFVGLDAWTGFGTFSLSVPNIPPASSPTGAEFLWAIAIGIAAAVVGAGIKRMALMIRPVVERQSLVRTPLAGLAIGVLAIVFVEGSDRSASFMLFSGQDSLPSLIENASSWTVGALLLLIICKGLAYGISLSSFRGGPVFPGLFIGAAGGIALSHLAGLPMIAGAAMGMGALMTAMLGLPLTSVMLTTLFLGADGLTLMPVVIVAVAVSYVASARLAPEASNRGAGAGAGVTAAAQLIAAADPDACHHETEAAHHECDDGRVSKERRQMGAGVLQRPGPEGGDAVADLVARDDTARDGRAHRGELLLPEADRQREQRRAAQPGQAEGEDCDPRTVVRELRDRDEHRGEEDRERAVA